MGIRDVVRVNRKTYFNPRSWIGYDRIKAQALTIWDIIKSLFVIPIATRTETFEEAILRLNLSPADLQNTEQRFLIYSIFFVALALLFFIYSFYLLFYVGTFAGWVLAIAVTALLLTQAFRFDFWRFQIKHRKLGCTFSEWKLGKPSNDTESQV